MNIPVLLIINKEQRITPVTDLGDFWKSDNKEDDVDFNACVVWHTDEEDEYSVFISTDTSKDAKRIISTYEIRAEIEENFRQIKDVWKLEDFKSAKENFIVFHVVCTLLGYLFYLLYCLIVDEGRKYFGKELPVLMKNYEPNHDGYYIIFYEDKFGIFTLSEIRSMLN